MIRFLLTQIAKLKTAFSNQVGGIYSTIQSTTSDLTFTFEMPESSQGMLIIGAYTPVTVFMSGAKSFVHSELPNNAYTLSAQENTVTLTKSSGVDVMVSVIIFH